MTDSKRREVLVDGSLAIAVLSVVVAAGIRVGASPVPTWGVLGAIGAALLEVLLARRRERVRRTWERPGVKVGSVLAGTALALGLSLVAPDAGLSALAGGLVGYLGLLIVVVLAQG